MTTKGHSEGKHRSACTEEITLQRGQRSISLTPQQRKQQRRKERRTAKIVEENTLHGYSWNGSQTPQDRRRIKRIIEGVKSLRGLKRLPRKLSDSARFMAIPVNRPRRKRKSSKTSNKESSVTSS